MVRAKSAREPVGRLLPDLFQHCISEDLLDPIGLDRAVRRLRHGPSFRRNHRRRLPGALPKQGDYGDALLRVKQIR